MDMIEMRVRLAGLSRDITELVREFYRATGLKVDIRVDEYVTYNDAGEVTDTMPRVNIEASIKLEG